jgi:hypothetical protein
MRDEGRGWGWGPLKREVHIHDGAIGALAHDLVQDVPVCHLKLDVAQDGKVDPGPHRDVHHTRGALYTAWPWVGTTTCVPYDQHQVGAPGVNVNVFSLGLSNATEEQQVYSAIWDMGCR